jgi:hypothetical protein
MAMETPTREQIRQIIKGELPNLVKNDPEMRDFILSLTRTCHPDKLETESRFDRIMEELKQDRLARDKKWDEQAKKWTQQDKRWDEQAKRWDEQAKKWDEQAKKWDKQDKRWTDWEKKWDEERQARDKRWAEQDKKWEANQRVLEETMAAIKKLSQKHDSTIGALGARWGLQSESAFRNGLQSILEESFNVTVERYLDYDHEGIVFGRPDQVELDVIIHNSTLILCEIKSSMSKSDLYAFWRKKNFYEKRHGRKASRTMVISPMIDDRARKVAETLNIEMFGYAEDVEI